MGEVTYQIQKAEKSPSLVVHADHLKLFHTERPPQSWLPPMVPGDGQRDRQTQTCRGDLEMFGGGGGDAEATESPRVPSEPHEESQGGGEVDQRGSDVLLSGLGGSER